MAQQDQLRQIVEVLVDIQDKSAGATEKIIAKLESLNKSLLELNKAKPNENIAKGLKTIAASGDAAAKSLLRIRKALKGNVIGGNLEKIATAVKPASEGLVELKTKSKEAVSSLQGLGRTNLNSAKIKTQSAQIVTSLQNIIKKAVEVKAALTGAVAVGIPVVQAPVQKVQKNVADTSGIEKQTEATKKLAAATKEADSAEKKRQTTAQASGDNSGLTRAAAEAKRYAAILKTATAEALGLQTRIKSVNAEQARAGANSQALVQAEKSRQKALTDTERLLTKVNEKIAQTSGDASLKNLNSGYLQVKGTLEGTLATLKSQNAELARTRSIVDQQNTAVASGKEVWSANTAKVATFNEQLEVAKGKQGELSLKTKDLEGIYKKAGTALEDVTNQINRLKQTPQTGILGPDIQKEITSLTALKTELTGVRLSADKARDALRTTAQSEADTKKSAEAFNNLKDKVKGASEELGKLKQIKIGDATAAEFQKVRQAIDQATKAKAQFNNVAGKGNANSAEADAYIRALTRLDAKFKSTKAAQDDFKNSSKGVEAAHTKAFATIEASAIKASSAIKETGKSFAGLKAGRLLDDRSGSQLETLQIQLKSVSKELNVLRATADKSLDALGNAPGTEKLANKFRILRDTTTDTSRVVGQRLTQVNQKLADIGQGGELTRLGTQYATTMREMTEAGAFMFQKVGSFFNRLGKATGASTAELQNYVFAIETLEKQLVRFRSGVVTWAIGLVLLGTTISAPFLAALKITTEFSDKIAQAAAVTNATVAEFDALGQAAESMGRITRFTATQAAEALLFLGRAGFTANKAIQVLPTTLNLAAAAAIDLGKAADIVTNIMTSFEIEAENLGFAADVLTKAFTSSNATLENIGFSFTYVGSLAKGLGVEFTDATAAIAKLANAGFKGTLAGTALRGVLDALFNPTRDEAKILDELSNRLGLVGLQIKNQEGNFVGFVRLLEQLESAGFNSEDALKLFGQRAGPGVAALLRVGSKALAEYQESLEAAEGTTAKIAATMEATFRGQILKMISALEGLGQSVGSNLAVGLGKAAEVIAKLLNTITELRNAFPLLAAAFDYAAATIAAVIAVAGVLTFSMFLMIVPLRQLIAAVATFNATMALGANAAFVAAGANTAWLTSAKFTTVAVETQTGALLRNNAALAANVAATNASAASQLAKAAATASGPSSQLAGGKLGGGIADFFVHLKTNVKNYGKILKGEFSKSMKEVSKSTFSLTGSFKNLATAMKTSGMEKLAVVSAGLGTAFTALKSALAFIFKLLIINKAAWLGVWGVVTKVGTAIAAIIRLFLAATLVGKLFKVAIVALAAAYFFLGESLDVVLARLGKTKSLIKAQQKELEFLTDKLTKLQDEVGRKVVSGTDPAGLKKLQTDLKETSLKVVNLVSELEGVKIDFEFDDSGALQKLEASYEGAVSGAVLYKKNLQLTGKALDENNRKLAEWQAKVQEGLKQQAFEVAAEQIRALAREIASTSKQLNDLNEDLQGETDTEDRAEITEEINALLGKQLTLQQQLAVASGVAGQSAQDQARTIRELRPYLEEAASEVNDLPDLWKSARSEVELYENAIRSAGETNAKTIKILEEVVVSSELQKLIRTMNAQLQDTESTISDLEEAASEFKDTIDEAFDLDISAVEGNLDELDTRFNHEIELIERTKQDKIRAALIAAKGETKAAAISTKITLNALTEQRLLRKRHYNDIEKQLVQFQVVQSKILKAAGDQEGLVDLESFILEQRKDRLEEEKSFEESTLDEVQSLRKAAYDKLKDLETNLREYRQNQRQLELDFALKTNLRGISDEREALLRRNTAFKKIREDAASSNRAILRGEFDEAAKFAAKAQSGIGTLLNSLDGDTFSERQFIRQLKNFSRGVDSTFETATAKVKTETQDQATTFDLAIEKMTTSLDELKVAIQDVVVALGGIPSKLADAKNITKPFKEAATSLGAYQRQIDLLEARKELNIITPKEEEQLKALDTAVSSNFFRQVGALGRIDFNKLDLADASPETLKGLGAIANASEETQKQFKNLTGVDPFKGINLNKLKAIVSTLKNGFYVNPTDIAFANSAFKSVSDRFTQSAEEIKSKNKELSRGDTILGSNAAAEAAVNHGKLTEALREQREVKDSLASGYDAAEEFLRVQHVADQTAAAMDRLNDAQAKVSSTDVSTESIENYEKEIKSILDILDTVPLQLAQLEEAGKIDEGTYASAVDDLERWRKELELIGNSDDLEVQKKGLEGVKNNMLKILEANNELFTDEAKVLEIKLKTDPKFADAIQTMSFLSGTVDSLKVKLSGLKVSIPTEEAIGNIKRLETALNRLKSVGYRIDVTPKLATGGLVQFATGGFVDSFKAALGSLKGFAAGGPTSGPVRGAGTGTSDSILSWLSNGEYVMDSMTTRFFGPGFFRGLQESARRGFLPNVALPAFATGGPVGIPESVSKLSSRSARTENTKLTLDIVGEGSYNLQGSRDQIKGLVTALKHVGRGLIK